MTHAALAIAVTGILSSAGCGGFQVPESPVSGSRITGAPASHSAAPVPNLGWGSPAVMAGKPTGTVARSGRLGPSRTPRTPGEDGSLDAPSSMAEGAQTQKVDHWRLAATPFVACPEALQSGRWAVLAANTVPDAVPNRGPDAAAAMPPDKPGDPAQAARAGPINDPDDPLPRQYGRAPLPSFWATLRRDAASAPSEFWADTTNIVLSPLPMLILLAGGGGAIATYQTVDNDIRDFYAKGERRGRFPHAPSRAVRDTADILGSPQYHIAVAAACYLASIPAQDEKFYDFSKSLIVALGLTNATTLGLKLAVFEDRPNGKRLGFPSGHTASSFAFASVVHDYYGPLVAAPFYGVGVFTGWGRLWDREHRFTDVWYGALLGTVIGHSVGLRHLRRFEDMDLVPVVEPAANNREGDTVMLMMARRF